MNVKEKYKKKYFVRLTGSAKGYRITCWCFLFIYVGVLIWFFYFNSTGTKLESIVLMFLLIAAFEIPMLLKIEKRELVEWAEEFKKKKISTHQHEKRDREATFITNANLPTKEKS
ncbi:Uncharacterised protein [Neisseria zoodegmatis]|uniref:Uncharacterized protein n=2 Tax=Neisseria zoodegmatis TaxID=326523 RepID=A0A378WHX9_9NEIS|nr:Uncharacterised protein [Neisseria zoodegmatis]